MKRSLLFVAIVALAAFALSGCGFVLDLILGSDLIVENVEVLYSGDEISGLRIKFYNDGAAQEGVKYVVVFSTDMTISTATDYVVYEQRIDFARNSEKIVDVSGPNHIQPYVEANNIQIPPGEYYLGVFIDPDDEIAEEAEDNNAGSSNDRFYFGGGSAVGEGFEIDVQYSGPGPFDASNPLKIVIFDLDEAGSYDDSGIWVVPGPGYYFFPADQIPVQDTNGSGYIMQVIHDMGNDWGPPDYFWGPGDTDGLYNEGAPGNIDFSYSGETVVWPGNSYWFNYNPPSLGPDAYEPDNEISGATPTTVPAYQYHNFHEAGDADWVEIYLAANDTLVAETFSAGGLDCDTVLSVFNSAGTYQAGNDDKPAGGLYSRLEYTATTAGYYYVEVSEFSGSIGEYNLELTFY